MRLSHLFLFLALGTNASLLAQNAPNNTEERPVKWAISAQPRGNGAWDVSFHGTIADHWVVYSQTNDPNIGPLPTVFAFDTVPGIEVDRNVKEDGAEKISHEDPLWDNAVITKFKGSITFSTTVLSKLAAPRLGGYFEYQTCNDRECLPPDRIYFRILLASNEVSTSPVPFDLDVPTAGVPKQRSLCQQYLLPDVDLEHPVNTCGATTDDKSRSLWGIFLLGFLGGLVALLTPCVFPMIPLTVSFFTKGSDDRGKGIRNAITYGLFILLIYVLFSVPFHVIGGVDPGIFNAMSTNPVLNVIFFAIFIVFAISFFGFFEITLPSSWVNRMDQNASRAGGVLGIFFMAFTLALVSFSCTGPILGSLLAGAITADGGPMKLTMGLAGFGSALALPFALFAMFPSLLSSLPKSGGWLNSVKVVLGFIEVAAAVKFYSLADMVSHWNTMPYELFMAIWALCAIGIVIYLLGWLRFPHDSPVKKRSAARWAFIVLFAVIAGYILSGFRTDPVTGSFKGPKLLSGIAPAAGYSWIHPKECPQDLDCYHDLCTAMETARNTGKPIMVDFTGYGCANCRQMEQSVWGAPGVIDLIRDKYVLVSLYVDDRAELPKEEQELYTTKGGVQKWIHTRGDRWSTLENETFHKLSQPWYALLSPDGELLNPPTGTGNDPFSVPEFKAFLECGLQGMEKVKAEVK